MSKFLKSFLFWIIIFLWLFNFQTNLVSAEEETYFIVTAYYSPLPNQKRYTTWSYYWDMRLNWEWHTTASWKGVYKWILAAPKKYPFWTKIYFDWFGIWAVEDRWWAIVKAWERGYEHDRIDIWMWYWDEWLQRALNWWKRKIKWKVVARISEVNLEYTEDILINLANIKVNPEISKVEDIKILQKNFKTFWLYKGEIDWKFKSIEKPLVDYQLKNNLIASREEEAAGWFWPKTYVKLLKDYWNKDILVRKVNTEIIETNKEVQVILAYPEIDLNWDNPEKEEVIKVQDLFKKLWLYSWKLDWNYSSIKDTLISFQKNSWIIKNDTSWWAWYFWEKTKAGLITYFESTNTVVKKKITIDDISYATLKNIWKKLQNHTEKDSIIKKLSITESKMKIKSQKDKIKYLIMIMA